VICRQRDSAYELAFFGVIRNNYDTIFRILVDAGYDGWITSEFVVPMDRSPLAKKAEAAGTTATEAELKFIRDHGSDLMSDAAYSKYVEDTIKTLKKAGV
jgi:sugar phosphate isomerase/epimerase